ncbi:formylglycine-generating enzyme family protein [Flavihumibacter rivuli]|uniref:formylglycine-generating enzyme family protein n=1 Tax=Flavihumibacter rivuli TaxID=2838156 RepID=UPI001BDE91A1|nr:formylglycine-generating enzyme family protein [Flavihumibacter rivuli]ULQ56004.1 formylglycine-generating enzyme family protein [Flavihumibacter rivuli]
MQANPTLEVNVEGKLFRMNPVPSGSFEMGGIESEEPHRNRKQRYDRHRHTVHLTQDFYLGETVVTQELWEAVMGSNPSHFRGPKRPVEMVSWDDTSLFIQKLNQQTGLPFRLPTEAEWEYACKAGDNTPNSKQPGSIAWYADNSEGRTHEVMTKEPNMFGLWDLLGNVYQWCQDYYDSYPSSEQVDPIGPVTGQQRVYRGASWATQGLWVNASFRMKNKPDYRSNTIGFRLALSRI